MNTEKSDKFFKQISILIVLFFIGFCTYTIISSKKDLTANTEENGSNLIVEEPNDSSTIFTLRDTISKNGSLVKDLKITYQTAMQIAKRENLPIRKDRHGRFQPIVQEGDIFMYYRLHSGDEGYFKYKPEHICLTFE